ASIASFFPGPNMAVYYATKAYVLSLTEALAFEHRDDPIKITALCPGPTRTGFSKEADADSNNIFAKPDHLPGPLEVAEYGMESLAAGKQVAIHGLGNKLNVFGARLLPRRMLAAIIYRVQG
ncbi:MAG: SDR family NAD(P)-dependent oxidoreductase, partial [Pseudomonadota bacterium]